MKFLMLFFFPKSLPNLELRAPFVSQGFMKSLCTHKIKCATTFCCLKGEKRCRAKASDGFIAKICSVFCVECIGLVSRKFC